MVADRQPEHDRRATSQRSGRSSVAVVGAGPGVLPADQQAEQDRQQGQVEGVGLGARPDRPDDRGQGQAEPGQRRPAAVERVRVRARSVVTAAATATDRPANRFIRKAGSPNGAEHEVGQPAQQDVGRIAGRVGGAHQRRDGLELAGVPEAEARAASPTRRRRTRRSRRRPAAHETRRAGRSRAHHPSSRPQVTPHALTAIETTTRSHRQRHRPAPAAHRPATAARGPRGRARTARRRG